MAEGKVIGTAYNLIKFKTDHQSLTKVLADIKKVKEAMKSVQAPMQKMRAQATATKKQVTQDKDWLIVQRQINKNKKEGLKTDAAVLKHQERKIRNTERQTKAIQKQQQEARKAATQGLITGTGTKANSTLFAQILKQEDAYNKRRDSILARRDAARLGRRINRANAEAKLTSSNNRRDLRLSNRAESTITADRWGLTNKFGNRVGSRFDAIVSGLRNDKGAISDMRMYRQQVSALRRDLSNAANAQRGFNGTLRDMRSMIVQATASYTAFAAIQGAASIGKNYESRQAGMLVATGSKEAAAKQSQYLDYQIRRLGLDYNVASKGYVQLGVAGAGSLSEDQVNKTFTGLSELGTAVQLDPMRYEKAILAISQMMN